MSAGTDKIKRYVGMASDALAYALRMDREVQDQAEVNPPVGAKSEYKPTVTAAIGGISTGTILLFAILWYFLKR
jgi:hypothetical protein